MQVQSGLLRLPLTPSVTRRGHESFSLASTPSFGSQRKKHLSRLAMAIKQAPPIQKVILILLVLGVIGLGAHRVKPWFFDAVPAEGGTTGGEGSNQGDTVTFQELSEINHNKALLLEQARRETRDKEAYSDQDILFTQWDFSSKRDLFQGLFNRPMTKGDFLVMRALESDSKTFVYTANQYQHGSLKVPKGTSPENAQHIRLKELCVLYNVMHNTSWSWKQFAKAFSNQPVTIEQWQDVIPDGTSFDFTLLGQQ